MLYDFNGGSNAEAATRNICAAYGDRAVDDSTCYCWFDKFHSEDTTLTDKSRLGRPVELDDKATVNRHLHALGKANNYGDSVPRQLSTNNLAQRVLICLSLLSRHNHDPFLERIVTGDEKWVRYINVRRRKQWLDPGQKPLPDVKADLHPEKIMLCIWWDIEGAIYFELLQTNQTITADFYSH